MIRPLSLALILGLAACAQPDDGNPVKGGDELSPFVGEPVNRATSGLSRAGYRIVGEEEGSQYWLNPRSGGCARTRFASGRLITVVQLPREACQTVSR